MSARPGSEAHAGGRTTTIGAPAPRRWWGRLGRHADWVHLPVRHILRSARQLSWDYCWQATWRAPRTLWRNRDITAAVVLCVGLLLTPAPLPLWAWLLSIVPYGLTAAALYPTCEKGRRNRLHNRGLRKAINIPPTTNTYRDVHAPARIIPRLEWGYDGPGWTAVGVGDRKSVV